MCTRLVARVATILTVGLLAAACSSAHHGTAAPSTASPPGAPTCPPGLAVGFYGALTGPSATIGINQAGSVQLAVAQFDAAHSRCHVAYHSFDSRGDPATAPALAATVAADQSVLGVIGPTLDDEAQQADAIFNAAGLPNVTVSATAASLAAQGWTTFHRGVANDNEEGPGIAAFIATLKANTVAVLHDGTTRAAEVAGIVRQQLEANGTMVQTFTVTGSQADPATITALHAFDPRAVFYSNGDNQAGALLRQLRAAGVSATFVTNDAAVDQSFVQAAGPAAANGAYLAAFAAVALTQPQDQPFVHAYQAMFHAAPGLYAAEAYDTANQLLAGILAGDITRVRLNAYLATSRYAGIVKTYAYGTNGELEGTPPIIMHTIRDGQITLVGPVGAP